MSTANIHASCVVCADAGAAFGASAEGGILLLGDSGSGKSDLALRLIAMGARLVADDRCEVFFDGSSLRARPPSGITGLMEIRGLGIVVLPSVPDARIALAVRLVVATPQRLPERQRYTPPPTLNLPDQLRPPEIPVVASAASAPVRILAAVAAFERLLFREEIA